MCVRKCVCVHEYVCVCELERERERENVYVRMCVCVCQSERGREIVQYFESLLVISLHKHLHHSLLTSDGLIVPFFAQIF